VSRTAILAVRIVSDAESATRGFDDSASAVERWQGRLDRASVAAGVALAGIGAAVKRTIDAASDQEQAFGAVESVFGRYADTVGAFARDAADSVGLASSEYAQLAAVLGAQLGNMGVSESQLAGQTDALIRQASDLAAVFGGDVSDAVAAVSSLLRGERDPIERYGVAIKQADIDARLAADGLSDLTGAALRNAEASATLALLAEQTASAQGAFARESDTAAVAQQRMRANVENAAAAFGVALLPAVSAAADVLSVVARWVESNTAATRIIVGVVAAFAVGILAANVALRAYTTAAQLSALWTARDMGAKIAATAANVAFTTAAVAYAAAIKIATIAQRAWNLALMANPIGLVVAAVLAIGAALVYAYKRSETFRRIVDRAFAAVRRVVETVVAFIRRAWDALFAVMKTVVTTYIRIYVAIIRGIIDAVRAILSTVRDAFGAAWAWVGDRLRAVVDSMRATFGRFRDYVAGLVGRVRDSIVAAFDRAAETVRKIFDAVRSVIDSIVSAIQTALDLAGRIGSSLPGVGGRAAPAVAVATAAPTVACTRDGRTVPAAAVSRSSVTVAGVVDPQATARLLARTITGARVRTGFTGVRL